MAAALTERRQTLVGQLAQLVASAAQGGGQRRQLGLGTTLGGLVDAVTHQADQPLATAVAGAQAALGRMAVIGHGLEAEVAQAGGGGHGRGVLTLGGGCHGACRGMGGGIGGDSNRWHGCNVRLQAGIRLCSVTKIA